MTNQEVTQITEDRALSWPLKNNEGMNVRRVAALSAKSQDQLWEMRNDSDSVVRFFVASRIEDQDRLLLMRASEKDSTVIKAIDTSLQELELTAKEDVV